MGYPPDGCAMGSPSDARWDPRLMCDWVPAWCAMGSPPDKYMLLQISRKSLVLPSSEESPQNLTAPDTVASCCWGLFLNKGGVAVRQTRLWKYSGHHHALCIAYYHSSQEARPLASATSHPCLVCTIAFCCSTLFCFASPRRPVTPLHHSQQAPH